MKNRVINLTDDPLDAKHCETLTTVYQQLAQVLDGLPKDIQGTRPVVEAITNIFIYCLLDRYGPEGTANQLRVLAQVIPRIEAIHTCAGSA